MSPKVTERTSDRLSYPFEHFQLPAERASVVAAELDSLADRYALFEMRDVWKNIVRTFIVHCSARHPSDDALRLLCHFLYMTLFFNESRSRGLDRELVQAYFDALRGELVHPVHPVLRAARDFHPRFRDATEGRMLDNSAFYHYLGLNLASFLSDASRSATEPLDPETALSVRLHSISALAYFQFWKLLLGVTARDELPCRVAIFRCELLSARIQGLANDLCSVERDTSDDSPNLVNVVSRHRGISSHQAFEIVSDWHTSAVDEYVAANRRAMELGASSAVAPYLELIRACIRGNLESMRCLARRYG